MNRPEPVDVRPPILLPQRRIVVFGGSGFIGRAVVDSLVAHGAVVTAAGRSEPDRPVDGAEFRRCSIEDAASVRSLVDGSDTIICLASSSLPGRNGCVAEVAEHLKPTVDLAQVAAEAGVERFIFASSGGTVYGVDSNEPLDESSRTRPRNGYAVSKLAIEHYLRLIGRENSMSTMSLRVSNPFGPGQPIDRGHGFIAAVFSHLYLGRPLRIWGDGSAVRDFVDVRDVAGAFLRACDYEGEETEINIGSGSGRSLCDVLREVAEVTGRQPRPEFDSSRLVDVARNVLDIRLAASELQWSPRSTFRASLSRTAKWWEDLERQQAEGVVVGDSGDRSAKHSR